jgi:hypothetical protein
MTTEELKEEIKKLEDALFYEQMADFMDWGAYHRINGKLRVLKDELKKREG